MAFGLPCDSARLIRRAPDGRWGSHTVSIPRPVRCELFGPGGRLLGSRRRRFFGGVNRHDQLQTGRLTDRAVALIVKRVAARAGLDPSSYAGHSLRARLATAAAAGGAPERSIMRQTGHKSVVMVRRYIRSGSLFQENAAAYAGF